MESGMHGRRHRRSQGVPGLLVIAMGLGFAATGAAAADSAGNEGARLAAPCAGCHGTGGRPPAGSVIPGLAGRNANEFVSLFNAYRSGERASEEMGRIARGYTDSEIAALAAWFAAQAPEQMP